MAKRSLDKPTEVFVEDAELQAPHLGDYSQNVNARCVIHPLLLSLISC